MKKVSWLITDSNITVNYDGQTHIVSREDKLADRLIDAMKNNKLDEIPNLVSVSKRVESFSRGNFVVKDGQVFVNGVAAPTVLANKIIKFSNEGLPYQPLVKFAENLQKNPSFRAVNELFGFLEKNDHAITETGCFVAYKRVREDFMDIYTGTFDNSPGNVVEMPRNMVDDNPDNVCSNGLHASNWYYCHDVYSHAENDVIVEVEINPADVISVPRDYNSAKLRCCKYKVLGAVDQENSSESSLRITDQNRFDEIVNDDEDKDECEEDEEEDNNYCTECGMEIEWMYDLCVDCEEWQEEVDTYPYGDEIED